MSEHCVLNSPTEINGLQLAKSQLLKVNSKLQKDRKKEERVLSLGETFRGVLSAARDTLNILCFVFTFERCVMGWQDGSTSAFCFTYL